MILFLLLLVLMLVAAIYCTGLHNYLTFEDFKSSSNLFKKLVTENYLLTVCYYIGIYFVVAALSLPGDFVLTIAGGFLFGTFTAAAYIAIGATAGAVLAFLTSRYLFGNYIQKKYRKQLSGFNKELKENGKNYILMLRFISLPPFFLLNILVGFTKLDLKTFIWTTALGILPATLIYAYAGSNLARIEQPGDLLSADLLSAFIFLGLIALVPVLLKKLLKMRKAARKRSR